MYGRAYQWLIMATYTTDWWNVTLDSECSVEEISVALEGAILVDLLPLSTSGDITVAGIVSSLYIDFFATLNPVLYYRRQMSILLSMTGYAARNTRASMAIPTMAFGRPLWPYSMWQRNAKIC